MPRRRFRAPLAPLVMVVLLLTGSALLAGCGSSDADSSSPSDPTSAAPSTAPSSSSGTDSGSDSGSGSTYVALGDSYAAAPGLPPSDPDGGACVRSLANYPHLIAKAEPSLTLADETCSGATSQDVIDKQASALSADTQLVTLSIGGNDGGLFIAVLGGCAQLASSDPNGSPCSDAGQSRATATLQSIRTNLDNVLTTITTDAPNAQVVVVDYPRVLPSDGTTCPALVPIASGDYPFVGSVNKQLSLLLKQAASAHGAQYVDLFTASAGHDVCAKDPWINGQSTAPNGVIPFHPFAAEQKAAAAMVEDLLR